MEKNKYGLSLKIVSFYLPFRTDLRPTLKVTGLGEQYENQILLIGSSKTRVTQN
jgi:hypothetical protein